MRVRLLFPLIANGALALSALGCSAGGLWTACGISCPDAWAPTETPAPHSRFHPVPTRPVFASPAIDAAPVSEAWPTQPAPGELIEPPMAIPLTEGASAMPALKGPLNGDIVGKEEELREPRRLDLPHATIPPASSRRVPGVEFY